MGRNFSGEKKKETDRNKTKNTKMEKGGRIDADKAEYKAKKK